MQFRRIAAAPFVALVALVVLPLLGPPARAQTPYLRTFLGSGGYERVQGVTVGPLGRVYVTGHSTSSSIASMFVQQTGGYDKTWNGGLDAFVAILSPDLVEVMHWTLFGGNDEDRAYQVEIDPAGNVVVVGLSGSTDLPVTAGAANHGGWDAFVARFSPDLSSLIACTALGGSADENPRGSFAVDGAGNVFLGGNTESLDFPTTPGAFQLLHAAVAPDPWDAFVAKIDVSGQVAWATLLGGGKNDAAYSGCRLAADGSLFVAGMTNSDDFPTTPGSFQPQFGGNSPSNGPYSGDGFVARLSPDGSQLLFSTFLGGAGPDSVAGNDALELDPSGNPVVIGVTWSADFPVTAGSYDTVFGGVISGWSDAYVAKLSADGSQLLASTFLGGERVEEPSGLAVYPTGEIALSGNTETSNFPVTPDASQRLATGGVCDAFVCKLSNDLRYLSYSTYLGGQGQTGHGDRGRGLALLPSGDIVIGGDTDSSDFPVSSGGVYDSTYNGGGDGFVDIEFLSHSYPFGIGKTSSAGSVPVLRHHGSVSVSTGSVAFQISSAVPFANGRLAWSHNPIDEPFIGGTWYLGAPVRRIPGLVTLDGAGGIVWNAALAPALAGESRVYQFWFRDAAHPDGTQAGLTNAVKVTFLP